MPKAYRNTADRTILGIEPGQTGKLADEIADGFVGPGALEVADEPTPRRTHYTDLPPEKPKKD